MDNVVWAALSVLAAVLLGALGYLSRQLARAEERLTARIDRLSEQYIRHLEAHARYH